MNDSTHVKYILSTGRTGTTQLREYLKKNYPGLRIWFEPPPSRQLYLLWNAEQAGFIKQKSSLKLLNKYKSWQLKKHTGENIIEFDSYLSPLVCDYIEAEALPVIAHFIRHPYTWIQSIGNFKAASWRRHAVDILPFTYVVHPAARAEWPHMDKILKLAWSWRFINERILATQSPNSTYRLFKFEDFVSENTDLRLNTLRNIISFLHQHEITNVQDIDVSMKLNKSNADSISNWQEWPVNTLNKVNEICGDLMRRFDYEACDQ